jgi:hypothetical protein
MFVCLNSLVMKVVSLPVYVTMAQFRAVGLFAGCEGGGWADFWGRIGKALLWRMLWMIFSSCWHSARCN